jgi:hypothetical protein
VDQFLSSNITIYSTVRGAQAEIERDEQMVLSTSATPAHQTPQTPEPRPKHPTHLFRPHLRMRVLAHDSGAYDASMWRTIIASGCLIWFVVVWFVCAIGFTQL